MSLKESINHVTAARSAVKQGTIRKAFQRTLPIGADPDSTRDREEDSDSEDSCDIQNLLEAFAALKLDTVVTSEDVDNMTWPYPPVTSSHRAGCDRNSQSSELYW
jgi:hypothetical protein